MKKLLARCPELEAVAACVEFFAQMMAGLDGHRLPDWLKQAGATGFPSLKSLVNGIRHFSSSTTVPPKPSPKSRRQDRGDMITPTARFHVTSKLIKRQMYGRVGFHLLRHRILLG